MDEKKSRRIRKGIFVVLLLIIGFGSWTIWQTFFNAEEGLLTATGTIEATTVELSAKTSGTIKAFSIKEGDKVNEGQLVGELERNDLVAQSERDALSVTEAENNLANLASGPRSEEFQAAEANVKVALTKFNQAQDDFNRVEALVTEGAVPTVDLEKAKAAKDTAAAQLDAAQAQLNLLESGTRPELIQASQTEVERLKAVLKATSSSLEDLKIISPLNGTVTSKNYETGEYVKQGASIATIANLDDLWVTVYVPTDDLPKIKLGQAVSISVSGSDEKFEGRVGEIADQGEFTPKTIQTEKERSNVVFKVKIVISSNGKVLKPGMPADVDFLEASES